MTHITRKVKRQLNQSLFLKRGGTGGAGGAGPFWPVALVGFATAVSLGLFFMKSHPIDTGALWICMNAACGYLDTRVSFENTARFMAEPKTTELMEKIVSLCKRRGFIFQSSEIYGGLNGCWDYGPLGAELKRNIKESWWRSMTRLRDDVVGLDASIIMHPKIWEASGHTSTFSDLMVDCLLTKKRFRADQIEPQSGMVYFYSGATDANARTESKEAFSVMIPPGKPPESARKVAWHFYHERGVTHPTLLEERAEKVEDSTR